MKFLRLIILAGCLMQPAVTNAGWDRSPSQRQESSGETEVLDSAAADKTAPAASSIQIIDAAIATGIEGQKPIGVGDQFPVTVTKLYCYTDTVGGRPGDKIIHRWLKDGYLMAQIMLETRRSPWRTWSSKNVMPDWGGNWTVEIMADGQVLKTLAFTIAAAKSITPGKPEAGKPRTGWSKLGLQVESAVMATGIKDHQPKGMAEKFSKDTAKLYCFTRIIGGKPGDKISHRWIYNGIMMDTISLDVNSSPWRTWSTKVISPDMTGSWSVDIMADDEVLKSLPFTVEESTR